MLGRSLLDGAHRLMTLLNLTSRVCDLGLQLQGTVSGVTKWHAGTRASLRRGEERWGVKAAGTCSAAHGPTTPGRVPTGRGGVRTLDAKGDTGKQPVFDAGARGCSLW